MSSQKRKILFQLVPPNAIQFHFNRQLDTYDTSDYSPSKTEGRMSQREINEMLQAINSKRKPIWDKYLLAISCPKYIALGSLVAFVLYQIYVPKGNPLLIILGVVGLIGIAILLLKFPSFCFEKARWRMRDECQVLVDQYNQTLAKRGLIWYIPHYFPGGIELRKEYEPLNHQNITLNMS